MANERDRWIVIARTALFTASLLSLAVAMCLKAYIIDRQALWKGRSDLMTIPFFGGDLSAPPDVAYIYAVSCILPFLLIPALALVRKTPR